MSQFWRENSDFPQNETKFPLRIVMHQTRPDTKTANDKTPHFFILRPRLSRPRLHSSLILVAEPCPARLYRLPALSLDLSSTAFFYYRTLGSQLLRSNN